MNLPELLTVDLLTGARATGATKTKSRKATMKREEDPGLLPVRAMDGQRGGIWSAAGGYQCLNRFS
jgi:hypothetical protein